MQYAVIGALVVGVSLGLFGSGGSILTVPVLVYLLHHEAKVAIAESLGIVGGIALVGALSYARHGLVSWRTAALFAVPGMVGTYAGAWAAAYVPGVAQLVLFAGVMLAAAVMMWRRGRAAPGPAPAGPARRPVARIAADGLGVGVLSGLVGVGGGFLIVPVLVLLGGLDMRLAVGTSLAIIALNSAAGFWKYLGVLEGLDRAVDWTTIGVFVAGGIAGTVVGRHLNARIDPRRLQRGFAAFLVAMAVFIVVNVIFTR